MATRPGGQAGRRTVRPLPGERGRIRHRVRRAGRQFRARAPGGPRAGGTARRPRVRVPAARAASAARARPSARRPPRGTAGRARLLLLRPGQQRRRQAAQDRGAAGAGHRPRHRRRPGHPVHALGGLRRQSSGPPAGREIGRALQPAGRRRRSGAPRTHARRILGRLLRVPLARDDAAAAGLAARRARLSVVIRPVAGVRRARVAQRRTPAHTRRRAGQRLRPLPGRARQLPVRVGHRCAVGQGRPGRAVAAHRPGGHQRPRAVRSALDPGRPDLPRGGNPRQPDRRDARRLDPAASALRDGSRVPAARRAGG